MTEQKLWELCLECWHRRPDMRLTMEEVGLWFERLDETNALKSIPMRKGELSIAQLLG